MNDTDRQDEIGRQRWFTAVSEFFETASVALCYADSRALGREVCAQFAGANGEQMEYFGGGRSLYYTNRSIVVDRPRTVLEMRADGADVLVRVAIDNYHGGGRRWDDGYLSADERIAYPGGYTEVAPSMTKGTQERIFRIPMILSSGAKKLLAAKPARNVEHGYVKKSEWAEVWPDFK